MRFFGPLTGVPTTIVLSRRRRRLVAFRRQRRRLVSLFIVRYRNYRTLNRRNRPCPSSPKIYGRARRTNTNRRNQNVCAKPLTFRRVCRNGRYVRAPFGVDETNIHAYVCIHLKKTYFRSTATGPLHRPLLYTHISPMSVFSFEQYGTGDARVCAAFFCPVCVSPRPLKSARAKTISPPRVTRYYMCTLVYIIILHFIYLFEKGTLRPVFLFLRVYCLVARRPRRAVPGRTPFGRRHTLYAKKKQNKTRQRSVGPVGRSKDNYVIKNK